jgi:hypothetical protein
MRGDPVPRGGERKRPNPIFLAHAAALTEFYVTLTTQAPAAGVALQSYHREGEAREPFEYAGKERALAPDATVMLTDGEGRELLAFVELDLGTMSHARLRQKAELYAAYAASNAWRERHLFLPALLFLTTTDVRAGRFLKALAGMLSHGPRSQSRRAFVVGAAGVAWAPHRLLNDPCLADLDGHAELTLSDVLHAARVPHEEALAYRREREEAEDEKRQRLREDPKAMREHLCAHEQALQDYARALGPLGEQTIELVLASTDEPTPEERAALKAIACDLDEALPEPWGCDIPDPGAAVISEAWGLIEHYRATQSKQIKVLAERHGNAPSLLRAWRQLGEGGLLNLAELSALPHDAERDAASRVKQQERAGAYLQWRKSAAQQRVRKAGPLGRLTHRSEEFYDQLDRKTLKTCRRCHQTIYPPAQNADGYGPRPTPKCHYCRENYGIDPYQPAGKESEAHQ